MIAIFSNILYYQLTVKGVYVMKFQKIYIEKKYKEFLRKKPIRISELVNPLSDGNYRLKPKILPSSGAVYMFWWSGRNEKFFMKDNNHILLYRGPNQREVNINFNYDWLQSIELHSGIPLYAGKTADCVHKRIAQHLQLGTQRGLSLGRDCLIEKRLTTSNQLRDRIERIFIDEKDTRNIILENVGVTFMELDGDEEAVTRFYLAVVSHLRVLKSLESLVI
jgi:hypothetical protein